VLVADRDGFTTVVVRPRFVWGRGDTTLLPTMTELARSGRFAWIAGGQHRTSTTHVDNAVAGLLLGASRGAGGNAYFVTDGEPVVFRDFVIQLPASQGVPAPTRSIPDAVARGIALTAERAWPALRLRGRPPLTRFAYWVSSHECTIRIDKATSQLGYRPVRTIAQGLEELRGAAS
jgi:nucleoside-diphosphate-sugar epimerase